MTNLPALPPGSRVIFTGTYTWSDQPRPEVWARDLLGTLWVSIQKNGAWGNWVRN